jgi:tetratricopeptide (TPR) repeat protein
VLDLQGRYGESDIAYQEALRRDPQDGLAWEGLSTVQLNLKRLPEAQEHCRIAAALLPVRGSWQLAWGLAALKNGDRAAAQAALNQLLLWKAPEEKELRKAMGLR